jgi:hypothetical protein
MLNKGELPFMDELGDDFMKGGIIHSLEMVKRLKNDYSILDMLNMSLLNEENDIDLKVHKYMTNFITDIEMLDFETQPRYDKLLRILDKI